REKRTRGRPPQADGRGPPESAGAPGGRPAGCTPPRPPPVPGRAGGRGNLPGRTDLHPPPRRQGRSGRRRSRGIVYTGGRACRCQGVLVPRTMFPAWGRPRDRTPRRVAAPRAGQPDPVGVRSGRGEEGLQATPCAVGRALRMTSLRVPATM